MTDIFDSIKQSAGQVLSNIDQKGQLRSALDGIRNQWNELERRRKTSSLAKEIETQQGEMRQLTEALGLQTLSLFDAGKVVHPELARLCERINELRAEIDAKKADLEAMKAQQQEAAQQAAAQQAAAQQAAAAQTQTAAPQAMRTVVRLRCPRCKTELTSRDDFCPTCGVKILHPAPQQRAQAHTQPPTHTHSPPQMGQQTTASSIRFCPSCGAETKPNAQFCPICGQALH